MPRIIFHIDVNSAFLSWSAVKMVREGNPDIQMSLFEDPKMEYYREWDRQYDEEKAKAEDALVFRYPNGEAALSAAKKAVKGNPAYRFHRNILDDGTDCFEVIAESKVLERHIVEQRHNRI